VEVGFAGEDAAAGPEHRDHARIPLRRLVGEDDPARGRDHARDVDQVLHRDHGACPIFGRDRDEGVELGALFDSPARLG
jgi:hypothetical protein